jgi:hypothetical protein
LIKAAVDGGSADAELGGDLDLMLAPMITAWGRKPA